jgi:hypothetical protein
MSFVFQNIDPPPPSPPGECVLPPNKGGGYTLQTRRAERGMGGQYFGRRETKDCPLTVIISLRFGQSLEKTTFKLKTKTREKKICFYILRVSDSLTLI